MLAGKRALVTGGAGFIGSHLVDLLLAEGFRVVAIDDVSTGSQGNLASAQQNPRFEFVQGSAGDAALIRKALHETDVVFHLAAAVGVALVASRPDESIERNIQPTQVLIEELREHSRHGRRIPFFLASTSEVYGKNPKPRWSEEDDLVFGATTRFRWSYGVSKAIDEFLTLASAHRYGMPIVVGRFFNVVGPRQTGAYGMVLPRFVSAAIANEPLIVHDDGLQQRCFAHVRDVARIVLSLMNTPEAYGKVVNIGSDEPITVLDLAKRVIALAESFSTIAFQSYAEAYDKDFEDVRRRAPDLSRLRALLGPVTVTHLDSIIRETISWKRGA